MAGVDDLSKRRLNTMDKQIEGGSSNLTILQASENEEQPRIPNNTIFHQ